MGGVIVRRLKAKWKYQVMEDRSYQLHLLEDLCHGVHGLFQPIIRGDKDGMDLHGGQLFLILIFSKLLGTKILPIKEM